MPLFKVQIHHDEDSLDDALWDDVEADTSDEAIAATRQRYPSDHYSVMAWSQEEWQRLLSSRTSDVARVRQNCKRI